MDTSAAPDTCAPLDPEALLIKERVRARILQSAPRPVRLGNYQLTGILGKGGMGVVFEARDLRSGDRVALKTLQSVARESAALKREFRAAADLCHPNLVSLHELVVEGQTTFFTMEYVEGDSLLVYLRADRGHGKPSGIEARTRACLPQIISALGYLHGAGCVHGDIKPQNFMMTREGRLVLLDFGLTTALRPVSSFLSHDPSAGGGTPLYMAPELFDGSPCTRQADWYAVGALLLHALCGRPPFFGDNWRELKRRKADPASLDALLEGAPEELARACRALLSPDPQLRPALSDLARSFGVPSSAAFEEPHGSREPEFVGRLAELLRLERALERSRSRMTLVLIEGNSGIGKTALVQQFLEKHASAEAIVLAGRCFERESVTYKAFEGPVDSLARHLAGFRTPELRTVLPQHTNALAVLFPRIRQVLAIQGLEQQSPSDSDEPELLRQAFEAFWELVGNLAERRPLIIWLDDLQWGDLDSASLLSVLLDSLQARKCLVLVSVRRESLAASACLQKLALEAVQPVPEVISLGPLELRDAECLAAKVLGGSHAINGQVEELAGEGMGNPLFVIELGRFLIAHPSDAGQGATFERMLNARIDKLSPAAKDLLAAAALVRGPMAVSIISEAAAVQTARHTALNELRASHLARTDGVSPDSNFEIYHDRIRELAACRLPPELEKQVQRALAEALERAHGDDELLYYHWAAAGELMRAARHAEAAARRAAQKLAFERAAALYREALRLSSEAGEQANLERALGDALRNAGRGHEAAEAYLLAAARTQGAERFELRQSAAREFVMSGRLGAGEALYAELLPEVGVAFPRTPLEGMVGWMWRRLQLKLYERRVRLRPPGTADVRVVQRMEACRSASQGLYLVDILRASMLSADVQVQAYRSGDPFYVSLALGLEAVTLACRGGNDWRAIDALLVRARAAADQANDVRAPLWVDIHTATTKVLLGDFPSGAKISRVTDQKLSEHYIGASSGRSTCRTILLTALAYLGAYDELGKRADLAAKDAVARGNLYESVMVRVFTTLSRLARDEPAAAEAELLVLREWPAKGFHLPHFHGFQATALRLLYEGRSLEALRHVEGSWKKFRRSAWWNVRLERVNAVLLRGIAAGSVFRDTGDTRAKRIAHSAAKALSRDPLSGATEGGKSLAGSLALAEGNPSRALGLWQEAALGLERAGRSRNAAIVRLRMAESMSGAEADAIAARACATLEAGGVVNPLRMRRCFVA